MNYLQTLDELIFSWLNTNLTNPFFDATIPHITILGDEGLAWLLLLFICFFIPAAFFSEKAIETNSKKSLITRLFSSFRLFLLLALVYGITAGLYISVKKIVDRPRPFEVTSVELRVSDHEAEKLASNGSFPSAHAANAFMLATLFSVAKKRFSPFFYFAAIMVAFSRIYLGVHFPFDVLVGAFLGWGIARIILSFQWLQTRLAI